MERGSKKRHKEFIYGIRKKLYQILPFGDERREANNIIANNLFSMFFNSGDISWYHNRHRDMINYIIKIINNLDDLELEWVIINLNIRKERYDRYAGYKDNGILNIIKKIDFTLGRAAIIDKLSKLNDELIIEDIIT